MGWFDGNPAHLWELPPADAAKKHVEYMGGADAVIEKVKAEDGNPRWAAQVLNYSVAGAEDRAESTEHGRRHAGHHSFGRRPCFFRLPYAFQLDRHGPAAGPIPGSRLRTKAKELSLPKYLVSS